MWRGRFTWEAFFSAGGAFGGGREPSGNSAPPLRRQSEKEDGPLPGHAMTKTRLAEEAELDDSRGIGRNKNTARALRRPLILRHHAKQTGLRGTEGNHCESERGQPWHQRQYGTLSSRRG